MTAATVTDPTAAPAPPGPAVKRDPLTVAAVLLPPLALYRAAGPGRDFWIACGLTVLGYLPGVAFALHQVLLGRPR